MSSLHQSKGKVAKLRRIGNWQSHNLQNTDDTTNRAMTTYLQLLSLDTVDSSPCVVVATEHCRFLFDSGEGIQRLCVEHRARISKLEGVCLTRLCPETIAGLPGLCLTAADAGKSQLLIVGPAGTSLFWDSTTHFMRRSNFNVNIIEPKQKESSSETESYTKLQAESSSRVKNDASYERLIAPLVIAPLVHTDMTVHCLPVGPKHLSYICETPQLAGKFDVVKALALKIPNGTDKAT